MDEDRARVGVEEVRKLAELAQLSLSEEEQEHFTQQLEDILGYAERIQSVDSASFAPTSHALRGEDVDDEGRLREDEPIESLDRDRVLEGAPESGEGLFKVPKVLP